MKISVISVTYNSAKIIDQTFGDLLNRDDIEIFVVDNKSSDNTCEILENLGANNLTVIKNHENIGYGRASNIAILKSSGEFILLINPDANIGYGDLLALADLAKTQNIGIIAPDVLQKSAQNIEVFDVDYVIFGIALLQRNCIDSIGIFDENIFMYCEDLDMCRRAKFAGFRVCECVGIPAFHIGGGSSPGVKGVTYFKEYQYAIAKMYYKLKHFPEKYSFHSLHLKYIMRYALGFIFAVLFCKISNIIKYLARLKGILHSHFNAKATLSR